MSLKTRLKWGAVLIICLLSAQVIAEETLVLKTEKEKVSYAIGTEMARSIKQQGIDIDVDVLLKGAKDMLSARPLLMSDDEIRRTMAAVQTEIKQKQMEMRHKQAEKRKQMQTVTAAENKKTGEAFLLENKTKEGVITLPSGLQYKILRTGVGRKPAETDTVEVHYRGTLINGKEFDSSFKRGMPATFQVNKVIRGWTEALQLMSEGSKWQLFIPPELGYGERGSGSIPSNSVLLFEVELLAVK